MQAVTRLFHFILNSQALMIHSIYTDIQVSGDAFSAANEKVVRLTFVEENAVWKLDSEVHTFKPRWIDVKLFELSTKKTMLIPPKTWKANFSDLLGDNPNPHDDIKAISLSDDEYFYIRASFQQAPNSVVPQLLVYFDVDNDSTTGSTTRENFGPVIKGWERRLELKQFHHPDSAQHPWSYEIVPGELGTSRVTVSFDEKNGWIQEQGNDLVFKVPIALLDLSKGKSFKVIMVDSWNESPDTVVEGEYSLE